MSACSSRLNRVCVCVCGWLCMFVWLRGYVAVCCCGSGCVRISASVWQCIFVCASVWRSVEVCVGVWLSMAVCSPRCLCVLVCGTVGCPCTSSRPNSPETADVGFLGALEPPLCGDADPGPIPLRSSSWTRQNQRRGPGCYLHFSKTAPPPPNGAPLVRTQSVSGRHGLAEES